MDETGLFTRLAVTKMGEFEKAKNADWRGGVPMAEVLDRVNRVTDVLPPLHGAPGPGAGRVRRKFTERSFRHYQTLGCIDPPQKKGRQAYYHFRHLVQAVLVRRLLLERVPSERIAGLMAGRGTGELEEMLRGGVEMVARSGDAGGIQPMWHENGAAAPGVEERWNRIGIAPGVELHMLAGMRKMEAEDLRHILERIEAALVAHRG